MVKVEIDNYKPTSIKSKCTFRDDIEAAKIVADKVMQSSGVSSKFTGQVRVTYRNQVALWAFEIDRVFRHSGFRDYISDICPRGSGSNFKYGIDIPSWELFIYNYDDFTQKQSKINLNAGIQKPFAGLKAALSKNTDGTSQVIAPGKLGRFFRKDLEAAYEEITGRKVNPTTLDKNGKRGPYFAGGSVGVRYGKKGALTNDLS